MNSKKINPYYFAGVVFGVILIFIQFFFNRSLWLDESQLGLNILNRNYAQLLQPLDYNQAAPISFLVAIPVLFAVAKKLFADELLAVAVITAFCFTYSVFYYANETKQYMVDVAMGLTIIYATLHFNFSNKKHYFLYALLGCMAIVLSNISIITLSCSGLFVFYHQVVKNKKWQLFFCWAAWAIVFGSYYFLFVKGHPVQAYMLHFWRRAFMPLNPLSTDFFDFVVKTTTETFGLLFGLNKLFFIPFGFYLIGIVAAIQQKKWQLLYFVLCPVLLHLIISAGKFYPFSGRLILYLVPAFLITIIGGLDFLVRWLGKKIFLVKKEFIFIPIVFLPFTYLLAYPLTREEIRPATAYLQAHQKTDDLIFIYHWAYDPFDFYNRANHFNFTNTTIIGDRNTEHPEKYDSVLQSLNGRVWLLFSSLNLSADCNEEKYTIHYLQHHEATILNTQKFKGATLYLLQTTSHQSANSR